MSALRLYCEVAHPTCSTPTVRDTLATPYLSMEPSVHFTTAVLNKQQLLHRQPIHAEARAIFTLAKELNFLIALCQELHIPLELLAIIIEDNSAVVTMTNSDSGYTKKCTHFLMVLNYIKEQIAFGQIEARKINGKLNNADMHTKPLRSSDFANMANKILGQPAPIIVHTPPSPNQPAENMPVSDMDANSQPSNERKRLWLPDATTITSGAKRRKEHLNRYVSRTASDSTMDTEVDVPAA